MAAVLLVHTCAEKSVHSASISQLLQVFLIHSVQWMLLNKHPDVAASTTGDHPWAPLTNISNTQHRPEDSDTRQLMLARIQARASKDLVKNPAVAVPGTRSIYVHAVTIVPNTEGAKQLGVAAQQFIETTLFSSELCLPSGSSLQTTHLDLGVVEELAACWNVRWGRRCSERLTPCVFPHLPVRFL